jgi:predicted anti-sigma-YlaC factor YlaD
MDTHARFEQLALSHVLGGLRRDDSDVFRDHLRACEACRARVAELRGISSSLDAAAREERQRSRDQPPPRRERPEERAGAGRGLSRLWAVAFLLTLALGVGFWNLHLRTTSGAYFAIAEERAAILRDFASGEILDDPSIDGLDARVAVTQTRVVLLLTDAGPLGSDERLVAWLLPTGSAVADRVVLAVGPRPDAEVAVRLVREAATQLVVTRERGLLSSSGPRGTTLLRVDLPR